MRKNKSPLIIGLTGSIGMGKSTTAKMLQTTFGFPVHNADAVVHQLLAKDGKAVKPVAKLFPEAHKANAISRKLLGPLVFGKPSKLKQLEKILHPLVQAEEQKFLATAKKAKAEAAILEIPLLFETGAQKRCDITVCVTAPPAVQKQRLMRRPGMTPAKLKAILQHQMPDAKKQKRADYVVDTGRTKADIKRQLQIILFRHI